MGVGSRRPPLPAPTDATSDNGSVVATDVATDVSRRTDRSSYSLPEDGSPITISTKKIKPEKSAPGSSSQTSLLIEYFEAGKSGERSSARPSVRVKVTPSSKHRKASGDAVKITEFGKDRKPSYTRRISLGAKGDTKSRSDGLDTSQSSGSNISSRLPIEVELLNNTSDMSSEKAAKFIPATSDISSMPNDSVLDGPVAFSAPERRPSRSLEQATEPEKPQMDTLKTPHRRRSRSLSRERIARLAAEKVTKDRKKDEVSDENFESAPTKGANRQISEEDLKAGLRTSKSRRRDSELTSLTDSSLQRTRDLESNVSGASKSSVTNNPRLMRLVEDTIKRMILPEIEDLKRRQSVSRESRGERDSYTGSTPSRQLSKSSSAPHIKPKVVLNRDGTDPGITLSGDSVRHKKVRRSSRDSATSSSRRQSGESTVADYKPDRRRKSKEGSRSVDLGAEGLTAAALRHHESRGSLDTSDRERRERRKMRGKSHSRSDSMANTESEYQGKSREIPLLPMRSAHEDSDITRESILSAETADTERAHPDPSPVERAAVKDTVRGSGRLTAPSAERNISTEPGSIPLPSSRGSSRRTSASQDEQRAIQTTGDAKATNNFRTNAINASLAAAGLGGAAAALYGRDNGAGGGGRDRELQQSLQSGDVTNQRNGRIESGQSASPSRPAGNSKPIKSFDSTRSSPSVQYPLTQKRHQGLNLEGDRELIEGDTPELQKDESFDTFFDEQSEVNNAYRTSGDFDDEDHSIAMEGNGHSRDVSLPTKAIDSAAVGPQVRHIGANALMVHNSDGPDSAVASLLGPSIISSAQSDDSPDKRLSNLSSGADSWRDGGKMYQESPSQVGTSGRLAQNDNPSWSRWSALRENAKTLSNDSKGHLSEESPTRDAARSLESEDSVHLGASGVPIASDPLPEIGHGFQEAETSEASDKSVKGKTSSIVEGPLGGQFADRDHWPYEPTPSINEQQERNVQPRNFAAVGTAARGLKSERSQSIRELPSQSSVRSQQAVEKNPRPNMPPNSATFYKDEGYMSSAPQADTGTPLSFSKDPPQLFKNNAAQKYDSSTRLMDDPFISSKRDRYLSGNSHGMDSPLYDAATGKGMDSIQSRDVVALMDHLTVRDGHRNARDTEILVTLVRSAAEMRNSFDDVKKFIEYQNGVNLKRTEEAHDRTIHKIVSGPRQPPYSSPRTRSIDADEAPVKKGNILKRALRGLGSRNTSDISRIEDMLMQLLGEVEALRDAQNTQGQSGQIPQVEHQRSMDTYERLRAAPDSGYEPDGFAGSTSSPNQSGNITSPGSRQISQQRMHSGYETNRVSTVLEANEDLDDFDNDDGMMTPTQEAKQQRSVAQETPRFREELDRNDQTPNTPGNRSSKHKSANSSSWAAAPKYSHWSKTTASEYRSSMDTNPEKDARRYRDQQDSEGSRSGSTVNVIPDAGLPYSANPDDRLRSANSLARDMERSPSPLIPSESSFSDGPRYQAQRNSIPLQHPQPRAGPTQRHQSQWESQAHTFEGSNRRSSVPAGAGPTASESSASDNGADAFGSVPALARARVVAPTHRAHDRSSSPISSRDGYDSGLPSGRTWAANGTRITDDGPLVPRDSAAVSAATRPQQHLSDDSLGKGVYAAYDYSRSGEDLEPADDDDDDDDDDDRNWADDPSVPLSRKRSPYSPGGLLAPIEERYSMEGDRSSLGRGNSQRSTATARDRDALTRDNSLKSAAGRDARRLSLADGGGWMHTVDEGRETPRLSPRPALAAPVAAEPVRKITGPRDMPRRPSGSGAPIAPGAAGTLMGTVRRKPIRGAGLE